MPEFTAAQRRAIGTIDTNLQVIACAGSGKTAVVAGRVARILADKHAKGIRPCNIVAFTFTERAAAELKDRITQTVGQMTGMADMYVGTMHGYCLQLLQSRLPEYFKYSVLTEVQARLLVDRGYAKSGMKGLGLRRWVESKLYLDVLSVLREADIDKTALAGHPALEALSKYRSYLDEKRYLDYTEILVRAVDHLERDDELRRHIAEQVKYLIVDEYQDVNPLQERLVRAIHALGANVCVVGDDDQTIYQWRGSDAENIFTFQRRYHPVTQVPIVENFRSSEAVVDLARTLIERLSPKTRLPKQMVSAGTVRFEEGDLLCQTFTDPREEAAWVASKAKAMLGIPFRDTPGGEARGLAPSDMAVLLRSVKGSAAPIVDALRERGLPVVVVGMNTLFDTCEVWAAALLFQLLAGRATEHELRRAWQDADLGISAPALSAAVAFATRQAKALTASSSAVTAGPSRHATYNLQRSFLTFLEIAQLREDAVPNRRGEVVYYNLGKFSQVISDYEQVHFHSDPAQKYQAFACFLEHQAPNYYPEGWQEAGYIKPDAVQVMTVHQAKGLEWPVVFLPCLQANRFPPKRPGGKSRWHVLPKQAVRGADRYDGSVVDERRLLYVALTRSKKYLFASWAPDPANQLYRHPSPFVPELAAGPRVLSAEPRLPALFRLSPQPRRTMANVALSFSELKYFFECPYEFKLRFLYGFNPPIDEALGYGKSLHDALAEVHKRALEGDPLSQHDAEEIVDRHLHLPFAYRGLQETLRESAIDAVERYLRDNAHLLPKTEHVEQVVEIDMGGGVVVKGRIDLIRRTDRKEIVVIDFKSTARAQEEDVSRVQLHIYALGYRELTGQAADLIQIYNLDKGQPSPVEPVSNALERRTRKDIKRAADALRSNRLNKLAQWSKSCSRCDVSGICRSAPRLRS